MRFQKLPGLTGKVYIPEPPPDAAKKHRCPDCCRCQMCSESRCNVCRSHQDKAETCDDRKTLHPDDHGPQPKVKPS